MLKYIVRWFGKQFKPETLLGQIFADLLSSIRWRHAEVKKVVVKKIVVADKKLKKKKKKSNIPAFT